MKVINIQVDNKSYIAVSVQNDTVLLTLKKHNGNHEELKQVARIDIPVSQCENLAAFLLLAKNK